MRKSFAFLMIFSILLIFNSICKGDFNVKPRELSIVMEDEFIHGNTTKSVVVTNTIEESINISWYLDHPTQDLIRENKTLIPSFSWISIKPKWQIIPPGSEGLFYIYLDIPVEKENLNKHWETWSVFKQEETQFFNWEHAIRLYIDTPIDFSNDNSKDEVGLSFFSDNSILISVVLIICITFVVLLFIIKPRFKKNKKP